MWVDRTVKSISERTKIGSSCWPTLVAWSIGRLLGLIDKNEVI